jgi:hypothetical protein
LSDQPSEALIKPLADDLAAAELLWHEILYFDLAGYLQDWGDRFAQARQEEKAIMAGEFTGELLTFILTWEASATRFGKIRVPPPSAAPAPVLAVAGGGSMPFAAAGTAAGVSVRVGGPIGGTGAMVSKMANDWDPFGDDSEPDWGSLERKTAYREVPDKDGDIINTAISESPEAAGDFDEHINLLREAVKAYVPDGDVYKIGTLEGRAIMGSQATLVGIVKIEVDNELLTYVIKVSKDYFEMKMELSEGMDGAFYIFGLFE